MVQAPRASPPTRHDRVVTTPLFSNDPSGRATRHATSHFVDSQGREPGSGIGGTQYRVHLAHQKMASHVGANKTPIRTVLHAHVCAISPQLCTPVTEHAPVLEKMWMLPTWSDDLFERRGHIAGSSEEARTTPAPMSPPCVFPRVAAICVQTVTRTVIRILLKPSFPLFTLHAASRRCFYERRYVLIPHTRRGPPIQCPRATVPTFG